MGDLQGLLREAGFGAPLIDKSMEIYRALPSSMSSWSRSKKHFLATREALIATQAPPLHLREIETLFGVQGKSVKGIVKAAARVGFRSSPVIYRPLDFVGGYASLIGLPDSKIGEVNQLITRYLQTIANVPDKSPQAIAAAAILYYCCDVNRISVDTAAFWQISMKACSKSAVKLIKNAIAEMDNH